MHFYLNHSSMLYLYSNVNQQASGNAFKKYAKCASRKMLSSITVRILYDRECIWYYYVVVVVVIDVVAKCILSLWMHKRVYINTTTTTKACIICIINNK